MRGQQDWSGLCCPRSVTKILWFGLKKIYSLKEFYTYKM